MKDGQKRRKMIVRKVKTTNLADGAVVKYYRNYVKRSTAEKLYEKLLYDLPWEHGEYNMHGKIVKTPRLLCAMRDEDDDITDVYTVSNSVVWTKEVQKIKKAIEKTTGPKIRYAQINYYRDGSDWIGYHTDKEVQEGDIIASISLGEPRKFSLRHIKWKENGVKRHDVILENGSLFIMNESAAKLNWKHTLPKSKVITDGRINITFRPN
jgi:alkylated DNA repair dioxygenase AlkB